MLSPSEGRRRTKDPDRERSSPKSKDKGRDEKKERHKGGRPSKSSRKTGSTISAGEREGDRPRERTSRERSRTTSTISQTPKTQRRAVVPEMERRASLVGSLESRNGSRSSLSYPTLSKTHAKENIYARDDGVDRRKSPFTPEATDVGDTVEPRGTPVTHGKSNVPGAVAKAPPSPPLTATTGADLRKTASANSMRRKTAEAVNAGTEGGRRSVDSTTRLTHDPEGFGASRSSLRHPEGEAYRTELTSTTGSSQPSTVKPENKIIDGGTARGRSGHSPTSRAGHMPSPAPKSGARQASELTQTTDSDATSVAPGHQNARGQRAPSPTNSELSPASVVDSSPLTPTQHSVLPSVVSAQKERPPTVEIFADSTSRSQSANPEYSQSSLPPPPPPPPPVITLNAPRVDYLLLNGGLPGPVVRNPLAAIDGPKAAAFSQYASPRPGELVEHNAQLLFKPLQKVLDDYNSVMDRNGSLAVATGYRSVARRLLDRLEAVFARNISSEFCTCIMCLSQPSGIRPGDDSAGVNWGEVLELVSGRCDLPSWPPFDQATAGGLGISELADPCQRIDVDVPEEYRAHYARQSRKTKVAVQSWLSNQQDTAPEEADDETLTFAMLTRLDPEKRSLFYALLCGLDHYPASRQQPNSSHGTPPLILKAAVALQRLYRLPAQPRDQLVVMYLIRNPQMHSILATLAAVTKQEWEILVSGRFDGFLWSGAESTPWLTPGPAGPSGPPCYGNLQNIPMPSVSKQAATSNGASTPGIHGRKASPTPSAFNPNSAASRPGSTRPGAGPAPVQVDEETEIAILAEVEREIHSAMDALENAFEHLHINAEAVRERLRNRSAALLMAAQARRGSNTGIEVRTDTPAGFAEVDGDNLDDLKSDIGPDDSASNVSHNRRRAHRHKVRRTPAPVEEEPEEEQPSLAERVRRRF